MLVEVVVGRIGRAHGIRGDVFIDVTTDEPERRFAKGATLRLERGSDIEVASVRWHRGRLVVSFKGYADRTAVEQLTGDRLYVDVPADERPREPDEYFDRQLVGLEVRRADGEAVGTVTEVQHMPTQDLLVVTVGDEEERLIPFVTALVPTVDVEGGFVQLADVGGLLEDVE